MSHKKVGFADKLLPDQHEHTHYYTGSDFMQSLYDTICCASGVESPHQEFALD